MRYINISRLLANRKLDFCKWNESLKSRPKVHWAYGLCGLLHNKQMSSSLCWKGTYLKVFWAHTIIAWPCPPGQTLGLVDCISNILLEVVICLEKRVIYWPCLTCSKAMRKQTSHVNFNTNFPVKDVSFYFTWQMHGNRLVLRVVFVKWFSWLIQCHYNII